MDGKIGLPPDAPYISAGFALTGFCEVMKQERQGTGISVTNVLSGRVDTPLVDYLKSARISAKIPPGKVSREIIKAIHTKSQSAKAHSAGCSVLGRGTYPFG
jgi:short-subunit dehydrogenase